MFNNNQNKTKAHGQISTVTVIDFLVVFNRWVATQIKLDHIHVHLIVIIIIVIIVLFLVNT